MSRRLLAVGALALLACVAGGTSIHATGNLEAVNAAGTAILTRVWHNNSLPIVWRFNDPSTVGGCSYTSTNAPAASLLAALQPAYATWQNDLDSRIAFTYGGTTATVNAGTDGVNAVIFCSNTAFPTGVLARTPTTATTAEQTVFAGGGCPVGQGVFPGFTFCFPTGTYPAGTIIDGDVDFNTKAPSTAEESFSTADPNSSAQAGKYDVQSIHTHELGHFFGLSHDPVFQAVMFPFIDDNPPSDGLGGQRVLKSSDKSTSGHYYAEPTFGSNYGSITGFITLDSSPADGVHVLAVDPNTMLGVAGRFSLSRFEDPNALGSEGPDFNANGGGFYRIDGLPPGNYYVYVEYFDNTDFFSGRLVNRYNITVANSSVATGCTSPATCGPLAGDLGFLPSLTEFHNAGDSGHGGDGVNAGTALDNSDAATLVPVVAGSVTTGIDIAINIEPVNGQSATNRQNPTTRTTVVNDSLQGTDRITAFGLDGGNDDFYAIRYPASVLPTPPYNVAEGQWVRAGRNDLPYNVRLTYGDPNNAARPALNDPIVGSSGRVLSGGPGGKTDAGDFVDVRDQWNVTINQSRDVWIVMNQPPAPPGSNLITWGYFILVARTNGGAARVNRTLVTEDGGATWGSLTADPFYDLILEADPPVTITSASPATSPETNTLDVTINGLGFQNGAVCDFGPNIVVNSTTFLSASQVRCNITVVCTGAVANREVNVKVINPDVVFPNVARIFTVTPAVNDNDCDGVTNALDCSPGDATLKHPATEVLNDDVTLVGGSTLYSWDSQDALNGSGTAYDVVTGLVDNLLATRDYSAATCAANDLADGPFTDPNPDPAPGSARYWLVRARNGCNVGLGTYGDSSIAPDPRDALDAGVPCP